MLMQPMLRWPTATIAETIADNANSGSFSTTSHPNDCGAQREGGCSADPAASCLGCHRRSGQKSSSSRTQGNVTNIDLADKPTANTPTRPK